MTMQAAMKLRPKGDWASFSLIWLPDLVAENLTDQGWQKSADRRGSYPQAAAVGPGRADQRLRLLVDL